MKTSKLFSTGFILLLILQQLVSQVPQGFKYQAVCRDNSGALIQNQAVGLRLSVHDSQPEGIIVYQETFAVTTNPYGLITVDVGTGNVVSGNFALIPWATGNKFLELELDPGSGFVSMGTSQLLSVPYALHAETAEHFSGELTEFDPVYTASLAAGISASDTAYWNSKLDVEMDGSVTNEIQFLSLSQDTIHLTDGGFVKLPSQSGWLLNGNSGTLDGTNFIGTSDNVPLNFRVNNQKAGRIDAQSVVFIGYEAGNQNIAQNTKNTAVGYQALKASNNHLHVDNTAVGYKALNASNGLGYNTAIGSNALIVNTVGEWNTGVGTAAANSNTSGSFNTSIGGVAMSHNSVGNHNTAVGFAALIFNGTGNENTSVGMRSMHNSSAASNNVALGYESGFNVGTGSGNVFLGYQAGFHETGSNKLYIANNALNPPLIYGDFLTGYVGLGTASPNVKLDVRGNAKFGATNSINIYEWDYIERIGINYNTENGDFNMRNPIEGKRLLATISTTGSWGVENTTGAEVVRITGAGFMGIGTIAPTYKLEVTADALINGIRIGRGNGNVSSNTAVGSNAMNSITTGSWNTALGKDALLNQTTGYNNTALGMNTLKAASHTENNTAVGSAALGNMLSGNQNTAVGTGSMLNNTQGSYNTSLGTSGLYNNTNGSNNTVIGFEAGFTSSNGSGNVFLGYKAGYSETGSNKLYIANNESNPPLIYGDFSTGFVGIGTTTPGARLQIKPTVDDNSLFIISPGDDSRYLSIYRGSNGAVIDVKGNAASYQPYLSLRVGGSEKMTITHSGNIGIGTTDPTAKLDVWNGNISVSNGGVLANTGFWGDALRTNWGNDLTLQSSYENKGIIFKTYSGEKMRIDADGNLGIGTATPATLLDVNGMITASGGNSGNWNTAFGWGNHADAGYLISVADTTVGNEVTDATNTSLTRSGSGTHVSPYTLALNPENANLWTASQTFNANTYFPGTSVWTSTGKVGIGTTNPGAGSKLEVWDGNVTVLNGGVLANTGFWGDILRTNWGNDLTLQSSYAEKGIIFRTQSGEKMRIDAAGKVGIGTASPSSILHLIGDSPKLKIQTQTNLTDPSLEFVKFGVRTMEIKLMDGGAGTGLQFIDQNSEQVRMYIKASTGHVGIGTIFPDATLDVNGQVKISGGSPGAGKVLTSNAVGLATWEAPASAGAHYIGEVYGGGIVFYVYDNGQHGLIAATSDLSNAIPWSNGVYKYTGTMGDGLGAGEMNTAMIVATQIGDNPTGNFAARICADYSTSDGTVTYGDWYLPSLHELNLLYLQKGIVGGFGTGRYWSSTEANNSNVNAWWVNFGFGYQGGVDKANNNSVRAIRAF